MIQQRSFGVWLKHSRKTFDLTQTKLASRVGCSSAAIRKIEAEERRPSAQIAARLAEIFDIPSNEQKEFIRFARGELRSAPAETIKHVPWHTSVLPPRTNLQSTTTSFIGREQETADIRAYLLKVDIRLVTLIGPPGIGKTRLGMESARQVLAEFPGGVFFVQLAPLDQASLVIPTIFQTLGYGETKGRPTLEQLADRIGDKQMLLLLDNFEHLMDGAAPLASGLLSACSRLKILVTSRESLRVPGEWLYPVPILRLPRENSSIDMETASKFPALSLFAERARAVRADFVLNDENIQVVASICAQLDGLPLAIELIAARIRLMSPKALLERLNEQFVLSADGMRAVPARQKTLQNAISWSYNLLSPEDQKLFAYLAVFKGGFTLEAVESIFSHNFTLKSVLDLTTSLLDKSLIQRTLDELGEIRYSMLVTIQQFSLDCLQLTSDESDIRDRHMAYFLGLAEKAEKEIHSHDQVAWMDRLEREYDNYYAALDWCVTSQNTMSALRFVGALGWFWILRGYYNDAHGWFAKVRSLPNIYNYPGIYSKALLLMGRHEWVMGNYGDAQLLLETSRELCLTLGNDGLRGLAEALDLLGMVTRSTEADKTAAQSFFDQSFNLYQKCGDQRGMAESMFHLGLVAGDQNNIELSLSIFEQSFHWFHNTGDLWGISRLSQFLGELYLKKGDYQKTNLFFEQHLMSDEKLKFKRGTILALYNLGTLRIHQADYVQAEQFFEKGMIIFGEFGLKGDRYFALYLYALGLVALHRNDYQQALQYFTAYFDFAKTIYEKISVCNFLTGLAAVAGGTNQPERAAKLYGAAQAILKNTGYQYSPIDRAEFDRHIQIARNQIDKAVFEGLVSEGRSLKMKQAVAYAFGNDL